MLFHLSYIYSLKNIEESGGGEGERVVAGEVGYANVYVTATELSSKFINGPISVPGNRINQLEGDFS